MTQLHNPWVDPEGETERPEPPWKSQVAICFLKNTGMVPLENGPIASWGRSVQPSVKYID